MHTYYFFIIRKEIRKIYSKNTYILFEILKNLYELEKENLVYGVSLYHQLCIPISTTLLSNYLREKIPCSRIEKDTYHLLSFYEKTLISIRHANIIVKSNVELSRITKIFNIYHENFFVCDFSSRHYFWLDQALKLETWKKRNI